ncbi:MAG: multiple sugar transport system substrate-binding protein [Kosmotogales bacterium]|nr:multiple sugar transport system substrate-binding protein [Kosmotogales bacterium]
MKKVLFLLVLVSVLLVTGLFAKTTITYWQYFYQTKKDTINELIKEFEKENPDIKVVHETFPYADFGTKVASSIPIGKGPDIIALYYGWLPSYVGADYLIPLPEEYFPDEYIDENFFSFVKPGVTYEGNAYALPTAVRALALFYNKKLFEDAGLDPDNPPATLDELLDYAQKLSKYDNKGNLIQEGLGVQPNNQGHHWFREILVRQFGGTPYSDDGYEVTYDSPEGHAAFEWYTELTTKYNVGFPNFVTDDRTAFNAQKSAMLVDGSFAIGNFLKNKALDWGVTTIPSKDGIEANFASFWCHGITKNVLSDPAKEEAAAKFLKFITSPSAMKLWLENVGELPANPELAAEYNDDPIYGPFLQGLSYANSTFFVDETAQRNVIVDAFDRVYLEGEAPDVSIDEAAEIEQAVLDEFYGK